MIGAYAICYKEADWLCFNLRRMQDWFDRVAVCVGPVEKLMGSEPDSETGDRIRDEFPKVTVIEGVWESKNQMASKAIDALGTDLVFQLDSDEVWPREAFDEAVELLTKKEKRTVLFHMYTFWKTPEYIMRTPDIVKWTAEKLGVSQKALAAARSGPPGSMDRLIDTIKTSARVFRPTDLFSTPEKKMVTLQRFMADPNSICQEILENVLSACWTPWLLDMGRAFRPCGRTEIRHIPPELCWPNGEIAHRYARATAETALWHFSYVGRDRVARKFEFFNKRHGAQVMPPVEYLDNWTSGDMTDRPRMTGQWRGFAGYPGPDIPLDVQDFVEGMQ